MLRTIRKYRRSVLGLVAIGLVALAMSGFGVNLINPRSKDIYAIKVNNRLISHEEVQLEKRSIEQRYRQMFGQNYAQFMKTFKLDIKQQAIDKLISDTLFEQAAAELGFFAGDKTVTGIIRSELFPNGFDSGRYASFLEQTGMSAKQFEDSIRAQALRAQFARVLQDVSIPSQRETRVSVERQNTKYSVEYVEFNPSKYTKEASAPSEEEIETYYNEHSEDFKEPAKASFNYIILNPQDFIGAVEFTNEDVELYYAEHQTEYVTPEEIRAQHILISLPKDADSKKKEELKKKAEEASKKAKEGEAFESLAKKYSDDLASATKGGEIGWVKKGQFSKNFDDAAFKLLEGEVSEIIETPTGFEIIKVEEIKPSRQKDLPEVRAEVEAAIRNREAPAYMSVQAAHYLESWTAGEKKLSDFAADKKLTAESSKGLLDKTTDPSPVLKGLTSQVIESGEEAKQLVDLGDKVALVEVTEFKPSQIATLSEVRNKIISLIKDKAAQQKAKASAQKVIDDLAVSSDPSLKKFAESQGLKVEQIVDASKDKATGVLAAPQVNATVFSAIKEMEKPSKVLEANNSFYVVQITSIKAPSTEEIESEMKKFREKQGSELGDLLLKSLLEKLKAEAKIDIDPTLMASKE